MPKNLQTKYEPRARMVYEASRLGVEGLVYVVYIEQDMGGVKRWLDELWEVATTSYYNSLKRVTTTLRDELP